MSKGGEVGEVKEVIVTEKQSPDAGHVVTGLGGQRPVIYKNQWSARATLSLRPDAGDQTLAKHCSAFGPVDVAVHREEEERTHRCVRSWWTERVRSRKTGSGSLLETTELQWWSVQSL